LVALPASRLRAADEFIDSARVCGFGVEESLGAVAAERLEDLDLLLGDDELLVQRGPLGEHQFGQRAEHPVAQGVLDLIPQPFHRVEFRTVGRQRDDPHVVRQPRVPVPQMEARAVLDQHVHRRRIAAAHLLVKLEFMRLVHRLGQQELRARQAHAHRPIDVTPLINLLRGRHRPMSRQTPHPARESVQPIAHLVLYPQPHRTLFGQGQRG